MIELGPNTTLRDLLDDMAAHGSVVTVHVTLVGDASALDRADTLGLPEFVNMDDGEQVLAEAEAIGALPITIAMAIGGDAIALMTAAREIGEESVRESGGYSIHNDEVVIPKGVMDRTIDELLQTDTSNDETKEV